MAITIQNYETVFPNSVYARSFGEVLFQGKKNHRKSMIMCSRETIPTAENIINYFVREAEDSLRNPSMPNLKAETQLRLDFSTSFRRFPKDLVQMIAERDKDYIGLLEKVTPALKLKPSESPRHINICYGNITESMLEEAVEKGYDDGFRYLEKSLKSDLLKENGLGGVWKLSIKLNGDRLYPLNELRILLKHKTSISSTIQATPRPYPSEAEREEIILPILRYLSHPKKIKELRDTTDDLFDFTLDLTMGRFVDNINNRIMGSMFSSWFRGGEEKRPRTG
ncbi:hypothetical protein HYX17_03845 [Candidatus Woesearchaeota archaeon]|nr:hypothetical protein [Candidatus Woesearchaeota archaeon]